MGHAGYFVTADCLECGLRFQVLRSHNGKKYETFMIEHKKQCKKNNQITQIPKVNKNLR